MPTKKPYRRPSSEARASPREPVASLARFLQPSQFSLNFSLPIPYEQSGVTNSNSLKNKLQFDIQNALKAEFAKNLLQFFCPTCFSHVSLLLKNRDLLQLFGKLSCTASLSRPHDGSGTAIVDAWLIP